MHRDIMSSVFIQTLISRFLSHWLSLTHSVNICVALYEHVRTTILFKNNLNQHTTSPDLVYSQNLCHCLNSLSRICLPNSCVPILTYPLRVPPTSSESNRRTNTYDYSTMTAEKQPSTPTSHHSLNLNPPFKTTLPRSCLPSTTT